MAKCIISSCKSKGCDLFCAPEDKRKLKIWQTILKTQETDFLICCLHFEKKFIGSEQFLIQNAVPTVLINPDDETFDNINACESCLKNFEADESKHKTEDDFKKIFFRATGIKLKGDGVICDGCHQQMTDYNLFITDLRIKHEMLRKQTSFRVKSSTELNGQKTFDPLDSSSPPSKSRRHQSWNHFDENGGEEDEDLIMLPPKKQEVFEIFDDNDDSEEHSDYFEREENEGEENGENFVVPVDPDSMYDNKINFYNDHGFPAHFLDFSESSSPLPRKRQATCDICHAVFPSIVGLRIHEKKIHRKAERLPTLSLPVQQLPTLTVKETFVSPKITSVPCTNCDASFKSYYHMQKHRDLEHSDVQPFKCTFPYCRTRGETLEEIEEHYAKFHDGAEPPQPKKRKRKSKKDFDDTSD